MSDRRLLEQPEEDKSKLPLQPWLRGTFEVLWQERNQIRDEAAAERVALQELAKALKMEGHGEIAERITKILPS